jgi:hypothetical protein
MHRHQPIDNRKSHVEHRTEGLAIPPDRRFRGFTGFTELVRQLPQVDILVNNLGICEPKPFEEIPDADWLRFFGTETGTQLCPRFSPVPISVPGRSASARSAIGSCPSNTVTESI